jgi:uncharacterized membrane protein
VLIALFGGLAGIVAISSKLKGNVIPGVAIATALMPPLCTAGYGLATAQLYFFLGAIYLFTINTVFIALSSVAISQLLKFPIRTIVEESHKKKVNRIISAVFFLVLFPSIYFGYKLVQKEKFTELASKYITNVSIFEGSYLLKSSINPNVKTITLVYGGIPMTEKQKSRIKEKAADFSLKKAVVVVKQGLAFETLDSKTAEVANLRAELNRLSLVLQKKDSQLDSIYRSKLVGKRLLNEISTIYPQISSCSYVETYTFTDTIPSPVKTGIAVFSLNKNVSDADRLKINRWLLTRTNSRNIKVFYEK